MNAILYGRVSTDKQDMARQDSMLSDYCVRNSCNPLRVLSDPDVSGSIPFRLRAAGAEVLRVIARTAERPLAFITTEQDRIGRDTIDQIATIRALWDARVSVHFTAEGGVLERTPENEMKVELRASIAQYERNKIKQRINSKMQQKRQAGELCGTVPYGWEAVPTGQVTAKGIPIRKLVANPDEQKWILHMRELRDRGVSWHKIAKDLNARGVETKLGGGVPMLLRDPRTYGGTEQARFKFTKGKWNAGSVRNCLTNKTVQTWLAQRDASPQPIHALYERH